MVWPPRTIGLAAFFNQAWPVALLPVALIVLSAFVIDREEQYLRTAFGPEYDAYCQRVRRWV